jgi:hypothetical protein
VSDRAAYTAGLRKLADLLDANPDLPLPYHGTAPIEELIFLRNLDHVMTYVGAMDEPPALREEEETNHPIRLTGRIGGYVVELCVRGEVYETRTVETVQHVIPAALLAVTAGADALREKPPADYRSQDDTQDQDGGDAG